LDRFENDSNNFLAFLDFPLLDFLADIGQTKAVLFFIVLNIISVIKRVTIVWRRGSRPVKSWHIDFVYSLGSRGRK
jgi:hypothetical protein